MARINASEKPEQSTERPIEKRDTRPRRSKWILAILLAIGAVLVVLHFTVEQQDILPIVDRAVVNVASAAFTLLLVVTFTAWFTFRSGFPWLARWAFGIVVLGGLVALAAMTRIEYFSGDMVPKFAPRWSGRPDQQLAAPSGDARVVDLRTTTPDDFPQFLGKNRNGIVSNINLSRNWSANTPRRLWRQPIGAGWAAFSAVNGFAVTMEQRDQEELITCYDVSTGQLMWWHAVMTRHESLQGGVGPRSTPTIDAGRVYALGATGVLSCLDGATGQLQWSRDLLAEFAIGSPAEDLRQVAWGRSASPLIVDEWVVVPAGGTSDKKTVSLVAYDKRTGEPAWESGDQQISYSSPVLTELNGVRQIVVVNESSVSGHAVSQEGQDSPYATGEELWEFAWPGGSTSSANVSQPVPVGADQLLLSKGYGGGAALLQLNRTDEGKFSTEVIWRNKTVLKTKCTNVVVLDDSVYGLSDGILECIDLQSGERRWKQGRYGHGQILLVGDAILVLAESGELVLVQANPEEHVELARTVVIEGQTWNNLCLYGSRLLVRNSEQAACYELPLINENGSVALH